MIGNEIFDGVTGNPQFWANFGTLINAAQGAGLSQDQNPFLMSATNDNFTPANGWPAIKLGEQSGKLKNLDSWAINIYRGDQFGGSGNSAFAQYLALMNSLGTKKPLIFGEWGTPHTTRPAGIYGQKAKLPIRNLDEVPESQMGTGQPYFAAQPVGTFLKTQWNTIKSNVMGGSNQVCVGGFIFDWCDEYWKGNDNNVQVGGPSIDFQGGAFAGGYWDEAGFGVTSAVNQGLYGQGNPISRTLFKGYEAVKDFYNAVSDSGHELYVTQDQLSAMRIGVRQEIHADMKGLKRLQQVDVPREPAVRRLLDMRLSVDEARLLYPADDVLNQLDQTLDKRKSLSRAAMRTFLDQLNTRLVEIQSGR